MWFVFTALSAGGSGHATRVIRGTNLAQRMIVHAPAWLHSRRLTGVRAASRPMVSGLLSDSNGDRTLRAACRHQHRAIGEDRMAANSTAGKPTKRHLAFNISAAVIG